MQLNNTQSETFSYTIVHNLKSDLPVFVDFCKWLLVVIQEDNDLKKRRKLYGVMRQNLPKMFFSIVSFGVMNIPQSKEK